MPVFKHRLPQGFAIAGLALAVVGAQSGPDIVARYREANGARILRDFATLLTRPNVCLDRRTSVR